MVSVTRLAMVLLLAQTIAPPLLASGAAAKRPAQADPKKKTAGHGSSSKEAKKSAAHGKSKAEVKDDEPAISTHVADVEKILSLIAEKEKKHDPRRYVEVDLGEFRVTRPGDDEDEIYIVRFHIYGVLNVQDQPKFDQSAGGRQQRLRDAVLSVVHRAQFEQLMDPALAVVKSELVAAINRIVENDFIRDIAFSTFCMEPS